MQRRSIQGLLLNGDDKRSECLEIQIRPPGGCPSGGEGRSDLVVQVPMAPPMHPPPRSMTRGPLSHPGDGEEIELPGHMRLPLEIWREMNGA